MLIKLQRHVSSEGDSIVENSLDYALRPNEIGSGRTERLID